jgi:nitroreductase/Pyruvate/2-oxoacid:ferredoxin oxidoreductase delta subunit
MILTIDTSACTRCGICARECPSMAVRQNADGLYSIHEPACIRCSHCAAVCPEDAVRSDLGSFTPWEPPGLPPEGVVALLRGKRSVRRYQGRPVGRDVLDEIVLTGSLTATASNAQDCLVTLLTGEQLAKCHEGVRSFFARIAGILRSPVVRFFLRFTEARRYVQHPETMEGLDRFVRSRRGAEDRVFYNAPVVVILSAPAGNRRFGRSNCVLAGAHMMLHAESLGLGSCMIGFAEVTLNMRPRLRRGLGVPPAHRVHLVFTLGYSDARYHRLPHRRSLETLPV